MSVDAARILRPPWTWNFKHDPPVRTRLEVLESSRHYSFDKLTAHLPDPAPRRPTPVPRPRSAATVTLTAPGTVDAHLRAIATEDYVTALTGQLPNDERKISCPFPEHGNGQEWIPSLQLRDRGEWELLRLRDRRDDLRLRGTPLGHQHQGTRVQEAARTAGG